MFTEQVGMLDEVPPDPLVEVLRFLLGNCKASLRHNGSLALLGNRAEGATDAVLQLENAGNGTTDNLTLPDANGEMPNGWALDVLRGAVRFQGPVVGNFGWAVANANWTNVAGDNSYVDCTLATDRSGTLDPRRRTVRIYLPRQGTGFDPAVYSGGTIQYMLDESGSAVGFGFPLSTRIGERKFVDSTSNIPTGWQLADGSNGTVDAGDALIGGYKNGGTFGTVDNAYGNSTPSIGTTGAATISLTIARAVTGIAIASHSWDHTHLINKGDITGSFTIDDHASHTHTIGSTSANVGDSGATVATEVVTDVDSITGGPSATLTHTVNTTGGGTQIETDLVVSYAALTHSITEPNTGEGHSHTGTVAKSDIASGLTIPRTVAMVIIERVA